MKPKVVIASAIAAGVFLLGILYFSYVTGNPIIPQSYELICRDKSTGNLITMSGSCESVADCQGWADENCGPENSCNNEKIGCKDGKCVSITYFRWDRSCV